MNRDAMSGAWVVGGVAVALIVFAALMLLGVSEVHARYFSGVAGGICWGVAVCLAFAR